MIYLQRSKKRRVVGRSVGIMIISIIAIALFYFMGSSIAYVSLSITTPVRDTWHNFIDNIVLGSEVLKPKTDLISEKQKLETRVQELEQELVDQSIYVYQNQFLSQALSISNPSVVVASILISYPNLPYDRVIIDKGLSSGVSTGMQVLMSPNIALGVVEDAAPNHSTIVLYSTAGTYTDAYIARTGESISIEGRGGGTFFIEAPKEFDIQEGDLIVLPGSKSKIVAVVEVRTEQENSSFVQVYMSRPLELKANTPIYIELHDE